MCNSFFSSCDLRNANLSDSNLSSSFLKSSNLSEANVENVRFGIYPDLQCKSCVTTVVTLNKLVICGTEDGDIQMWDYEQCQLIDSIDAHEKEVTNLHISGSGKKLASCSRDCSIKIWDIETR